MNNLRGVTGSNHDQAQVGIPEVAWMDSRKR
jgi:hypothetical protein